MSLQGQAGAVALCTPPGPVLSTSHRPQTGKLRPGGAKSLPGTTSGPHAAQRQDRASPQGMGHLSPHHCLGTRETLDTHRTRKWVRNPLHMWCDFM